MEAKKSNKRELQIWCNQGRTIPFRGDVKLDVTFLKKMGLSKQRMEQCNALFFYQLLLPIVDPAMSTIDGNTRMGYYKDVARNTNMYSFGVKNRGGTCRQVFRPTTAEELLVWDGIVCCNINTNIAELWTRLIVRLWRQCISEDGWTLKRALSRMSFGQKRREQTKDMI
jgi:hypothetical protein